LIDLKEINDVVAAMYITERLLIYSLILSFNPKTCLELGCFYGGSTILIAEALKQCAEIRLQKCGHLYSVDTNHQMSQENINKISDCTTLIKGVSWDVTNFKEQKIKQLQMDLGAE
jgi:cephalosporin hydroxylase